jgi:CheY-like chemotaxis protein
MRRNRTKILIVDDDAAVKVVLQELLEDQGYEVQTAGDGTDGYTNYLRFKPEVVITDIQMPRCDGIELMRHIRAHDPRVMAIYISADLGRFGSLLEDEKRKYNANLLAKPFSRMELMPLLQQIASCGIKSRAKKSPPTS